MKGNFRENYPSTAGKFDTSADGFTAWCLSCADHNWMPSPEVWLLADDLCMLAVSWTQPTGIFYNGKFARYFVRLSQELDKMARKTGNNLPPKRAKWQGFIDYRLTEDELTELDGWEPTPAELWEYVHTLMQANCRVQLSYNANTKTASCTITDDEPARKSGGWALTSSDGDCLLALKAAVFKHFHVLQGSWDHLLDAPNSTGRRG